MPSTKDASYSRCLTIWTDHLKDHSSIFVTDVSGSKEPVMGKFKVYSAEDLDVGFQYVYDKNGESRYGQFEGRLHNLPLSNPSNPNLLPALELSGIWSERPYGAEKWSFTGTGYFELDESGMNEGISNMWGEWTQTSGDRGTWSIDLPTITVEKRKDACFAGK